MIPTDKYAERARELSECMCDGVREPCVRCKKIARALEHAEAEGIQWAIDNHRSLRTHYRDERGNNTCGECFRLRARLAELRPEVKNEA